MRLRGKRALITGGSGSIGRIIARRYLEEGAEVIITGRNREKLRKISEELRGNIHYVVMDGSKIESIRAGIEEIKKKFQAIDILINNAGAAGPMQTLANIPLTEELQDAVGSLLGSTWFTTCALLPLLSPEASVINVSTIFSKTDYFGRAAYVVPKAAVNILSHLMAEELRKHPNRIRINTVYPGPVESERIDRVFQAMDGLKGQPIGTTGKEIIETMLLPGYVSKEEVANTYVFLGSEEGSGFINHDFEVTHGIQYSRKNQVDCFVLPNTKTINLLGHYTWIIAGDQLEDASILAEKHYEKGSEILLTFKDAKTAEKALNRFKNKINFRVQYFNPLDTAEWETLIREFTDASYYPGHVFVLPQSSESYGNSVIDLSLKKIDDYIKLEIVGSLTIAHWLAKIYQAEHTTFHYPPSVVFLTNSSDGQGNAFAKIRSAACQQIIRIFRHEGRGSLDRRIWQLIRYNNEEKENLDFTTDLALSTSADLTQIPEIDLALSEQLQKLRVEERYNPIYQQLAGDLEGKVALITGASEGIGRGIAQMILHGGARVAIVSRNRKKLEATQEFLVDGIKDSGFREAENRVFIETCDVTNPDTVEAACDAVISHFGRIDFLINNAGIAGEEQLVYDMSVDGWRTTLRGNLISNYALLLRVLPLMKKQKNGHIVNISSIFGGSLSATPSYPNRADYAVTKAGQRAFAETFAPLLGPEVKTLAISPGPVEGGRLRGSKRQSGLFLRRARLNQENKRVNLVYEALVEIWRDSGEIAPVLEMISVNRIARIENPPEPIRNLLDNTPHCTHLLTRPMAEKLLCRLRLARCLPPEFADDMFFKHFTEPSSPLFSEKEMQQKANSIRERVLKTLSLGRMPSEYDVGREVVLSLTSKSLTGETIYPSCGMNVRQISTRSDFIRNFHPVMLDYLQAKTVIIVGDSMFEEMATIASTYSKAKNVENVVLVVGSEKGAESIKALSVGDDIVIKTETLDQMDAALDRIFDAFCLPDVLISLPLGQIPEDLPSVDQFTLLFEQQLTNHFQIARRGALIDHCHVFFITPSLPSDASQQTVIFTQFIRNSLAALTVTAGQESARISHQAIFYQLDHQLNLDLRSYRKRLVDALIMLSLPKERLPFTYPGTKVSMWTGHVFLV